MRTYARRFCLLSGLLMVVLGLTAATAGCGGNGEETTAPAATTEVPVATTTARSAKADAARKVFEYVKPDEPGCSVAVGEDGEVVWAEGFGMADLEAGVPITPDTVFAIASTTKQFTTTALLLLVQEGKLDLDAPISRYLPQLPSWGERVTLRQMMHMESGIPDAEAIFLENGHTTSDPFTYEDEMALLREAPLDFEPGTSWAYSITNYHLFALVVESLTGLTLPEYVNDVIFEPLGMKAEMARVADLPDMAIPYGLEGDQWVIVPIEPWEPLGSNGIWTTPSDLVRWSKQYWDPTIGGPELLAARTEGAVEFMAGWPGDWRYGAGIMVGTRGDGGPVLLHPGGPASGGGFTTELIILPDERLAASVTCNRGEGIRPVQELATKVLAIWRGSEIGNAPPGT